MATELQKAFLSLVRFGIGASTNVTDSVINNSINWDAMQILAREQGLLSVLMDGIEKLPETAKPSKILLLRWIGEVLQQEMQYTNQQMAANEMAQLLHGNGIRTYVLKGAVVAECYPKPEQRLSTDLDCFFVYENQNDNENNSWEKGNLVIENIGFEVKRDFYKNSTFLLPGLIVENHRFMVPFRGNKTLRRLEKYLQIELCNHKHLSSDFFPQTFLCHPPLMVSALFLIEHAYSHFLHEGLIWRQVLDWVMFSEKHKCEINWNEFDSKIDEFGFRKFYNAYVRMGKYMMGEIQESSFTCQEKKMLSDLWAPLDLHETVRGFKGKLALASNTLRARWKYYYYSEISMPRALWIQVSGFLFERNPKLN